MGGKTKQSQRTKNNVRPSSSGRSALLLSNVKQEPGVMNNTGTELPALFPTLIAPNIDPLISPELQLCIKKLNKKDPITKTKALQELSELVSKSKVDDIVALLPSWAHFYKILTSDPDRKVREATQACHGGVVAACGRRVAPQLKQLMAAWLQAQHDDHAPAQALANASLAKTFPDSKLPEVISFCKSEVMAHLVDNLIGAGESAFIRKSDTPEEKEMQVCRIVTSSLHGLQYTVVHLPRAHDAWLWEQLENLFRVNVFWKRATDADAKIRGAWYAAVGRIIERYKSQFAEQYGQKTLRILIGGKESNPLAAAQLWDCVLLFMYNVEEWYKYLDKKELFNKRILDLLESGGWGDARHLSNMLLPLLAHLPETMLTKEFYIIFFDALFNGLENKSILSSKSERQSWITSLDECLRYLSIQQQDYVLEIVTSVHRTWLEKILSDAHDGQIRTNLIKYSAGSMAALVKYWLKQARESHSEKYDQLIRNFWQNVGATLTTQIDKLSTDHDDIGRSIDGHILLLQTLKTSFVQEAKKQQSIKFDGDSPTVTDESPKETPQCDASIAERYNHNLNDLVEKICGHYFEFASNKQISSAVLTPLMTLLVDFDSGRLFGAVARHFRCSSAYGFYEGVLRGWLAGDAMRCRVLVDIVFLLMKHLSEPEQDALFDSFKQFPPSVVEWCISLSLSHPHCLSPSVRRWLRGTVVEATVTSICSRVIDLGDSKAKNLLLMCLTRDASGEFIISKSAVSKLVEQLSRALGAVRAPAPGAARAPAPALEQAAALAAQLAAALPEPGLDRLALALFQLNLLLPQECGAVSAGTWRAARAAWRAALAALRPAPRRRLLRAAAARLHRRLRLHSNFSSDLPSHSDTSNNDYDTSNYDYDTSNDDNGTSNGDTLKSLNVAELEHAVSLCPYLWGGARPDVAEVAAFSRDLLATAPAPAPGRAPAPAPAAAVETYALRHDIVRGDISCPFEDGDLTKSIIEDYTKETIDEVNLDSLVSYANDCVFRAIYLRTILLHRLDEDLEGAWCDVLLSDDYFVTEFCKVLHDFMVIYSMYEAYAFSPYYTLISETKERLNSLIEDVINECMLKTRVRILNALSEEAAVKGYYWSFTMRWFELQAKLDKSENHEKLACSTEKTECSQTKSENNEDKTINSQEITENSQEKIESREEVTQNCQNEADSDLKKTEDSQSHGEIKAESNDVESLDLENIEEKLSGSGFFHTLQANDRWSERGGSALRTKYLLMLRALFARGALLRAGAAGARDCGADVIVDAYYADNDVMLYERDVTDAPWSHVASNAAVADYLAELVAERGWDLPAHHWDFTNITLCNLLTSVVKSKEKWGCSKVALLTRSVLNLYMKVEQFISSVKEKCLRQQPSDNVLHLPHEWADIFLPDLTSNLFSMIMFVLERSGATQVTANHVAVLDGLIQCCGRARWAARGAGLPPARAAAGGVAALAAPAHHALYCLAYRWLRLLLEPLVLEDAALVAAWSAEGEAAEGEGEERAAPRLSLALYDAALRRLHALVGTATAHVRVCEATCELVEFTDVHGLALSWFLLADIVAEQCGLARGDLQHHYIQIYRERKYAEPLLETALRLLPAEVFAQAQGGHAPPQQKYVDMFTAMVDLHVYKPCGALAASGAACRALARCVRGAGAGDARGWRGAAPHRHATLLDNIVHGYISPQAVKEEFTLVQQRASELEDMEVTIHWSTYEMTCILTVDERPIELRVTLSRSHPLGLPKFVTPEHTPIGNTNWLVMYMGYQNGTLLNALKMWIAAITSKVERSAQCYICYCRLHFSTGRLPGVHCYQCRNKFHTACLRKWFATSNKSNCPLCRTSF